jgi:hypothetical protein
MYYRDVEKAGMNERLLTFKGAKTFNHPIAEYRFIDQKYFQPTPTFIYGNKIVLISWKPTTRLIFIESEELSDAFRKHFEALGVKQKRILQGKLNFLSPNHSYQKVIESGRDYFYFLKIRQF